MVWLGIAWCGRAGFELDPGTAWFGWARSGEARYGTVRLGWAGRGSVWSVLGEARSGMGNYE